jgi:RNA polymerase sigma-70 factor (ECF subfamily)
MANFGGGRRVTPDGDTAKPAERLVAGDRRAFADLYDRLAPRMFGAALSMTGSTPEAEDAVQDVFVELARSRHRLPGIVDLEAYMFTMLHHAIGRRRRRQAVERQAVERIGADRRSAGGLVQEPGMPADDDLAAAVARLPTAQREVVSLKIDGGLTFAQIAAVLGTNINTAAGRYRAALDKLRAAMTPPEAAR